MTHLLIGDQAPNFNLSITENLNINLAEIKNKLIVLYFYPKDSTPGCTIEAKEFNDLTSEFAKIDAIVFGISKDSIDSHLKFKKKYELDTLNLLTDNSDVCEKYGVFVKKKFLGKEYMGINRTTFLLDKDHKIIYLWDNIKAQGHAYAVLQIAQQFHAEL